MNSLAVNGGTPVRKKQWAPWPSFSQDEIDATTEVLKSGKVNYWSGEIRNISGHKARGMCGEFEVQFAALLGAKYAIALANGTVALELAINALGLAASDEIIVPNRTFIATASACVAQGVTPVFADIEIGSQCISLHTIKQVVTDKTRAIICVHLAGWSCEMDEILDFARPRNIKVIEDCAQSLGGKYKGKVLGTLGDIAAFSFCQDKIITTGGEGGMVVTNEATLYKKAWEYKDHGKNFHYFNKGVDHPLVNNEKASELGMYSSIGTNFRMTEMQAAVGIKQLEKLPGWILKRRRSAEILAEGLSTVRGIKIYSPPDHIFHAYYKYYAFLDLDLLKEEWSRDKIIHAISKEGVVCQFGSTWAIGLEAGWKKVKLIGQSEKDICLDKHLDNDQMVGNSALMFQVHPTLDEEMIRDTIKAVRKVMEVACIT